MLAAVPGRPWKEATLEAAPGTITPEKAAVWQASGINRVSLGVQSFVQEEIAATGRKHTAEIVVSDIEMLRQAGIANYNIDLIAGLARQTMASWRESLDWIERLAPPHVSVYMLEVDDDSRLGREKLLGGVRYGAETTPSESETAEMYEFAVERLEALGIRRYEISNFARPGFESIHNLKYWRFEPYVGFGADAHSFDGAWRWQNVESPAEYVEHRAARGDRRGRSVRGEVLRRAAADGWNPPQPGRVAALRSPHPPVRERGAARNERRHAAAHQPRRDAIERSVPGVSDVMIVDLRSDTVTKPTPEMRRAMAEAEVGDDVYGEDPTVNRLERRAAEILGKEAALFVPTGTMANTIGVKLHTEHGQEVICESRAHVLNYELAMMAWFSGCVARAVRAEDGILSWDSIREVIRPLGPHWAPTGLIEIENTSNMTGGTVYPLEVIREISRRRARAAGSKSTWTARACSTPPSISAFRCGRSWPESIRWRSACRRRWARR